MFEDRRAGAFRAGLAAAAVALGVVAAASAPLALAQGPAARGKAAGKAARGRPRGNPAPRKAPDAADPLAARVKDQGGARPAAGGTFHYRLRLRALLDETTLAASYYPGRADTTTPAVLLVHEKDRSGKDFEDPIAETKGLGLAEHLQSVGYAVFAFDLRGYGANTRRPVADRDWAGMVVDLQAAYLFLLDRHNRGELNVARLGVVALGEGANLAAAWAAEPGGAVSSEGRLSDIAGMALISPMPEGSGHSFTTVMSAMAPRVPTLLMAGERDNPSHDALRKVRAGVERVRLNKVELFPSSLHGYKMLRLEPKAATTVAKFLEGTVKLKATEWEPRYNLNPVTYTDIQVVRHTKPGDKEKDAPRAKEPAREKAEEKEKAEGEAKKDAKAAPEK